MAGIASTATQAPSERSSTPATMKPSTKSFRDLPPELRVQVYDHFFATLNPTLSIDWWSVTATQPSDPERAKQVLAANTPWTAWAARKAYPNLMRASAFIRKEATPQYRQHLELLLRSRLTARTRFLRQVRERGVEFVETIDFDNVTDWELVTVIELRENFRSGTRELMRAMRDARRIEAVLEDLRK